MKRILSVFLIMTLVLSGCSKSSGTTNAAVDGDLDLTDNQTLLIAQVSAINGNEITLALAEEVDMSSIKGNRGDSSATIDPDATVDPNATQNPDGQSGFGGQKGQGRPSRGDSSSTTDSTSTDSTTTGTADNTAAAGSNANAGQMPGGDMPSGDMPSGDMPSGDMPSGGMPNGDNSSGASTDSTSGQSGTSNKSNDTDSTNSDSSKQSQTMYTLTGEEKTMLIPVGTPVTTLLGTVSTFSRIAVENTVKVVVETNDAGEEVIVAIYIVG